MEIEQIDFNAASYRGYKIAVKRIRAMAMGSYEAKGLPPQTFDFNTTDSRGFAWGHTKEEAVERCKQSLDEHLDKEES